MSNSIYTAQYEWTCRSCAGACSPQRDTPLRRDQFFKVARLSALQHRTYLTVDPGLRLSFSLWENRETRQRFSDAATRVVADFRRVIKQTARLECDIEEGFGLRCRLTVDEVPHSAWILIVTDTDEEGFAAVLVEGIRQTWFENSLFFWPLCSFHNRPLYATWFKAKGAVWQCQEGVLCNKVGSLEAGESSMSTLRRVGTEHLLGKGHSESDFCEWNAIDPCMPFEKNLRVALISAHHRLQEERTHKSLFGAKRMKSWLRRVL